MTSAPTELHLREPDRATFYDLGRTRLRAWEWGDDTEPAVLLVHGGWDHGRMWDGLAPRLAALGYHVVAMDLRGHGDSGRHPVSGSYWLMYMLDLAQMATRLGPPIRVVGHSFGGGQALSFGAAFPELVERIVNIDGMGPPPEMMRVQDHAASAAQWIADAERLWSEPQREYPSVEDMAAKRKGINIRLPMEWCRHLAVHGTRPGPNGGFVWKSDQSMRLGSPMPFSEEALRAEYRAIRCPVLVLTGDQPDQWGDLPDDVRDERLSCIADVRHVVVPGAGHYVHIESPDEVVAELERFLATGNTS